MIDLFCIASGPSLTAVDCELVRASGAKIVAVNNSWKLAPFADYLYAGDKKWWAAYMDEIQVQDGCERWTCSLQASIAYGLKLHKIAGGYNSGLRAIQFGIMQGFKSIGLLGYDCSIKNGIHWHGPHQKYYSSRTGLRVALNNPGEGNVGRWKNQFEKFSRKASEAGIKIFNCSRYSELDCFQRINLEDALALERKAYVD